MLLYTFTRERRVSSALRGDAVVVSSESLREFGCFWIRAQVFPERWRDVLIIYSAVCVCTCITPWAMGHSSFAFAHLRVVQVGCLAPASSEKIDFVLAVLQANSIWIKFLLFHHLHAWQSELSIPQRIRSPVFIVQLCNLVFLLLCTWLYEKTKHNKNKLFVY